MRELENRTASVEHEDVKTAATTEAAESETKFAGGKPPPASGAFGEQSGTAQLAFEEDENEKELKDKVGKLVAKKFGGDYQAAFAHYDKDGKGGVTKGELVRLLDDAGVGNGITRGVWANKIIDKLDRNNDAAIEWSEFQAVFTAGA